MNIDRRINLDLSMPSFGSDSLLRGRGDQSLGQGDPDSESQARFAAAMASKTKGNQEPPAAATSPFSLFQSGAQSFANHGTGGSMPCQEEVVNHLGDQVERLMVGDGSSGNRQVRMEIKDDLLPGVSVAIQELEGRLQVDFICSEESARQKLNRALPDLAHTLAQRLGREVLMRVQTDDEDDPCLLEALGKV